MDGFYLLVGHLVGDFILQDDWQAAHKANPHPGENPSKAWDAYRRAEPGAPSYESAKRAYLDWLDAKRDYYLGHAACTLHCFLYTLAVGVASWAWMPAWGLAVVFASHWLIDRYRLARLWMVRLSNQQAFATGPLAPHSVVVVDQVLHLAILAAVAVLARGI